MTIATQSSGLTATVRVTASPGTGQSWNSSNPILINWGVGNDEIINPADLPANYEHTYTTARTYTITVTCKNNCNAEKTCTVNVTVSP